MLLMISSRFLLATRMPASCHPKATRKPREPNSGGFRQDQGWDRQGKQGQSEE
jgi:hypothetical protein